MTDDVTRVLERMILQLEGGLKEYGIKTDTEKNESYDRKILKTKTEGK